jgi:branched-chain amino acid transport system permease protein
MFLGRIGKGWQLVLLGLLALLPFYAPPFYIDLATQILIAALFAVAYNICMGYGGMLSLGHGALYGIGSYTLALLLKKAAVSFPIAFLAAPVASGVAGVIIGHFLVRVGFWYFATLTIAFGQLVWVICFKWYGLTGGSNGIIGIPLPDLIMSKTNFYLFTLLMVYACIVVIGKIMNSPFGIMLRSIRDNAGRATFVGINVPRHRQFAFALSAFFSGVAGALTTVFNRGAFTEYIEVEKGIEPLLASLLGGMHILSGPVVGSVLMLGVDNFVTRFTKYWQLVMGGLLLVLVLFFPDGVLGYLKRRKDKGFVSQEEELRP